MKVLKNFNNFLQQILSCRKKIPTQKNYSNTEFIKKNQKINNKY
jgi:hypothetical protein